MDSFDEPPPPYGDPNYVASTTPLTTKDATAHRILHVYHQGLTHRNGHVLDSDKTTELFSFEVNYGHWFNSKPHTMKFSTGTEIVIGTVRFNSITPDMDLTVHNQPMPLTWSGSLLSGHNFRSAATGSSYQWKLDGKASIGDMVCLNEENRLMARFYINNAALRKEGKFECGPAVTGILMDEIVVSGLAIVEYRRNRSNR